MECRIGYRIENRMRCRTSVIWKEEQDVEFVIPESFSDCLCVFSFSFLLLFSSLVLFSYFFLFLWWWWSDGEGEAGTHSVISISILDNLKLSLIILFRRVRTKSRFLRRQYAILGSLQVSKTVSIDNLVAKKT